MNGGTKLRELFPLCDELPVLILSIRLTSITPMGLPPGVIHQAMYPYLPGSIELYDIPFDLNGTSNRKKYDRQVDGLIKELVYGRLSRWADHLLADEQTADMLEQDTTSSRFL